MHKYLISLFLLACAGAVHADQLADANALFKKKSYPEALALYTRLANGGNVEAQRHLGEMYWYGEAGVVDDARAESWFRKAAAKGDRTAAAALEVMQQRELRRADIDYWVSKYDGAELKSGKFRCVAPRIPSVSKLNEEITRIASSVEAWQDCYNGFVGNVNAHASLETVIPPDVIKLLNKQEMEAAAKRMEEAHQRIVADASIGAKLTLADYAVWRSATEAYVKEHNEVVKSSAATERGAR